MAPVEQSEKDALSAQVLGQLSKTSFACSSLTLLGGGSANFVFRGTLSAPASPEPPAKTVIVKRFMEFLAASRDFKIDVSRCYAEASMVNALNSLPSAQPPIFKVPRLHLFDRETHTQVHEDFPDAVTLKEILVSPVRDRLLVTEVSRALGSRLRLFHDWASEPAQAGLRSDIAQNEPMRKIKYLTYNGVMMVLGKYPEVLEGCEKTLEDIRDMAAKEFDRDARELEYDQEGNDWGLIHGDFWTGNVLLPDSTSPATQHNGAADELIVIDWELAQIGRQSYDLGQMVGDLCEQTLLDNAESAAWAMEGFANGYGPLSDEVAFRTAIHAGAHFVNWHIRRPPRGPLLEDRERIVDAMKLGRDIMIKGWEKDKEWFGGTLLAPLFRSPVV